MNGTNETNDNTYHIDRNRFLLNGEDVSDEFFGSLSPQDSASDIVQLRQDFLDLGWMTKHDNIVIDNLDHCLECGAVIENGEFCSDCQRKFDRHDDMMADAAWLGHTF